MDSASWSRLRTALFVVLLTSSLSITGIANPAFSKTPSNGKCISRHEYHSLIKDHDFGHLSHKELTKTWHISGWKNWRWSEDDRIYDYNLCNVGLNNGSVTVYYNKKENRIALISRWITKEAWKTWE